MYSVTITFSKDDDIILRMKDKILFFATLDMLMHSLSYEELSLTGLKYTPQ